MSAKQCTHRKLQVNPLVSKFYRCALCGQYIPKGLITVKTEGGQP